uniref:Thiosulfate sulfurtransferase n=1 Tax=Solibacter usitatus (strain Ellin6076) TaxID=234267 RepID=Q01UU3_SOLUE
MIRKFALLALFFAALAGAATCGGHGTPETMIVSPKWLAAHLADPNLVILAVGEQNDYDAGHIPSSQFIVYKDIGEAGPTGLILELPPMPRLAEVFGKYGVSNSSRVVVYRLKDWLTPIARVLMTLDAMGLGRNAAMLDGNLEIWKEEGGAVTTDVPTVKPGKIEPCPQDDVIATLAFVRDNLHSPGFRILDARSPEAYNGDPKSVRPGIRAGHIEGAGNVHYDSLLTPKGKLLPAADLQAKFTAAGVKPGDRVVTYCFIGQQASALYWFSRYLGYDTRLYDGSMDEWSKHDELPIVK